MLTTPSTRTAIPLHSIDSRYCGASATKGKTERMGELLGLNFNQPVRCSLSFRRFRRLGKDKPHGRGIARFDGRVCQVFKEPIKVPNNRLAKFLRDYEPFVSKIFIGHVRYASQGNHTFQNLKNEDYLSLTFWGKSDEQQKN